MPYIFLTKLIRIELYIRFRFKHTYKKTKKISKLITNTLEKKQKKIYNVKVTKYENP